MNKYKNDENIDAIIIDYNMDEMKGDKATKIVLLFLLQIKKMINEEGYINSIIIGHSADNDREIVENFKNNGADYFE